MSSLTVVRRLREVKSCDERDLLSLSRDLSSLGKSKSIIIRFTASFPPCVTPPLYVPSSFLSSADCCTRPAVARMSEEKQGSDAVSVGSLMGVRGGVRG